MDYSRLKISALLLVVIIGSGTAGYIVVEGWSAFDALYMTIITISTVGFGETHPLSTAGRVVTLCIIVSGIGVLTYSLGLVAQIIVEGELRRLFGRRKLEKKIAQLKDHYIICGFGRIGSTIAKELSAEHIPIVVIEQAPLHVEQIESCRYLYLNMDATADSTLLKAGLHRAKGLVTAVSSDADNVFIALSAKGLRPDIFILARASDTKNEDKLLRAGASRVVCPYQMGGRRMAEILQRPTVVDFIDNTMMNNALDLKMEEAVIGPTSMLIGKTIVTSNLRQDFGVIIVAIKKASNEMIYNPMPTETFDAGDVIVVIGKKDGLRRMTDILT
ncbi:MAG: potassium channel protein [Desulfocapsaceae bacterium]|nr:potassium channel protein [Desulfocapsaceae bacterium]